MSRATAAMDQLTSATALLYMTASFCEEPESFEPFRAWARKQVQDVPDDLTTPEERAAGLKALDGLERADMLKAVAIVQQFVAGMKDAAAMSYIPDALMEAAGRAIGRPV